MMFSLFFTAKKILVIEFFLKSFTCSICCFLITWKICQEIGYRENVFATNRTTNWKMQSMNSQCWDPGPVKPGVGMCVTQEAMGPDKLGQNVFRVPNRKPESGFRSGLGSRSESKKCVHFFEKSVTIFLCRTLG